MTPSQPNYNAFERICAQAVVCNSCFPALGVERAFVDLAQPRYVGPGYWTASKRRLFLMINPSKGKGSAFDAAMREDIRKYRDGAMTLDVLFRPLRGYMATWRRFLPFIAESGASLDEIALLNIAWCATKSNKYPPPYLEACWNAHTRRALDALAPTLVVACGDIPMSFATGPSVCMMDTSRHAARGYRKPRHSDENVIRLLHPSDPKMGRGRERYACYRDGMTLADYRAEVAHRQGAAEAVKCPADLRWDVKRNFIRVDPH